MVLKKRRVLDSESLVGKCDKHYNEDRMNSEAHRNLHNKYPREYPLFDIPLPPNIKEAEKEQIRCFYRELGKIAKMIKQSYR
jgi:hypothetical protein